MTTTIVKLDLPLVANQFVVHDLIIGHFGVLHHGHQKLFANRKDFSFLIFQNNPNKTKQLYSLQERLYNLTRFKPKHIFVYDILVNNLPAEQFITEVLCKLAPQKLVCGADFAFGRNKSGNIALLQKYFPIEVVPKDVRYQSRVITNLVEQKDLLTANQQTLYPFFFRNQVVKNKQLGAQQLFATANLTSQKTISFPEGCYAAYVLVSDDFWTLPSPNGLPTNLYEGIMFVGIPKSFETNKHFVEAHLFAFDGDLYQKYLSVYPLQFIRPNQKFFNLQALKQAIAHDISQAQAFFATFRQPFLA